jgi:hypothetical protein
MGARAQQHANALLDNPPMKIHEIREN